MCSICDSAYFFSEKQKIQLNKKLNTDDVLNKAINQLYDDRKIDEKTKDLLFASQYEPLKAAVNEGYSAKIEYNTPHYEFLKQLQTNTAVFAAFKNHASMQDMAALLKDKDGNLRSKEDFKKEALKVDATYKGIHLDVEYDTAVGQARMAAQWQEMNTPQRKRLYPNLKYIMTTSAHPRETHLSWVGIIRSKDDAFWDTHHPKNGYRCKCSVEETDDDTTDLPDNLAPPDKGFAFNPGKMAQVFDVKNSNYIKSVPPKEQPALIKKAEKYVAKDFAENAGYDTLYESKTGNKVDAHPLSFDNGDFNDCIKYARELANLKNGPKTIQILPDLNDSSLRDKLLPDVKGAKNPDYRIDNTIYDLKVIRVKELKQSTISSNLSDAHDQGNGAVLVIPEDVNVTDNLLNELINEKFHRTQYKDFSLYLKYKGEWKFFTWDDWQKVYNK